jgi:chromate transport protein ChrA
MCLGSGTDRRALVGLADTVLKRPSSGAERPDLSEAATFVLTVPRTATQVLGPTCSTVHAMVDCGFYPSDGGDDGDQAEQRFDESAHGVTSATQPVLPAFVRASTLHIGAAAATAALRHELVESHGVEPHEIDGAYAVSRVTPGTNLLALYALLGHRLGGWNLAVQAVALGAFVPASVAVLVAFLYTQSTSSVVAAMMAGARAGGVAVFLGAAVRLLRPQLSNRPRAAIALAAGTFVVGWVTPISPFAVLLIAGVIGAVVLRTE